MMKYIVPEIKPYHFITEINTTNSVVVRHYTEEAHNRDSTTEVVYTRVVNLKDIISYID